MSSGTKYFRQKSNDTEDDVTSSTATPEEEEEVTKAAFDDPNFIPGDFLDPWGNVKLEPEPPVTDILVQFMERLEGRKTELWQVGALILFSLVLQVAFILLSLWTLGVFIPLYNTINVVSKNFPKDEDEK